MLLINRDFEVLRLLCELALETGSMWIEPAAMMKAAEDSDLSAEYVAESLSALRHRRLVDARESINGEVLDVEVTPVGFRCIRVAIPGRLRIASGRSGSLAL